MKLDRYLSEHGILYRDFAEKLGVHVSQVSRWAAGKRSPSLRIAVEISVATGGLVTPGDLVAEGTDAGEVAA